jgi:hypothetical protein
MDLRFKIVPIILKKQYMRAIMGYMSAVGKKSTFLALKISMLDARKKNINRKKI